MGLKGWEETGEETGEEAADRKVNWVGEREIRKG